MRSAPHGRTVLFALMVTAVVVDAAAILVGSARWLAPSGIVGPTPVLFWILAAGLFVAETRPPSWLTFGKEPVSVSWVFAFSLVLTGAPAGALLVAAVAAVASAAVARSRFSQGIFNVGQVVVSLFAGIAVLEIHDFEDQLQPGRSPGVGWMVAVIVAGGAIYGMNACLVAAAMALKHSRPFRSTVVDGLRVNLAGAGVLLALAPIIVAVGQRALVLLPFAALTAIGVFGLARSALGHEHDATHDPLTELANRRGFRERAELLVEARGEQMLAVILADLDRFKPINDRYGHAAGDDVLSRVAGRIAAAAPEGAVAARLGGDEFAIAWLCDSSQGAREVGDDIARALSFEVASGSRSFTVRGSVGISIGAGDLDSALGEADVAMYRAKQGAGEVAIFQPGGGTTR